MQQKGAQIFYGLAKCLQFVQNHCTVEERGQCIDLGNQQKKTYKTTTTPKNNEMEEKTLHTVISPPKHSEAICAGSKGFTSASLNKNHWSRP